MTEVKKRIVFDDLWDQLISPQTKKIVMLGVMHFGDQLDWDEFGDEIKNRIADGELELRIFRESDNYIYGKSLISEDRTVSKDTKVYSFTQLKQPFDATVLELRKNIFKRCCTGKCTEETKRNYRKNFSLRTMCLDIPIPMICIDDRLFLTMSLTKFSSGNRCYELINSGNSWYQDYIDYFKAYTEDPKCSIKFSGEVTYSDEKGGDEILELYDVNRVARGLYPRDSFYSTNNAQLVIWDFVFSRDGKVLLHKRGWNAKDNVAMWDKSVGGHVDYVKDFDSTDGATRELVEELFTKEGVAQTHVGGNHFSAIDTSDIIFLGDWNNEVRGKMPFAEIADHPNQWFYFRLPYNKGRNEKKELAGRRQRSSDRIMQPVFRKDGEIIDKAELKKYFSDKDILDLVHGSYKYYKKNTGIYYGKTDEHILNSIESTDLLYILDESREAGISHGDANITFPELMRKYGIDVSEGDEKKQLNVIADIYFFIAADTLTEESVERDFENSDFLLKEIEDIREMPSKGYRLSPDMIEVLHNSDGILDYIEECVAAIKRMKKRSEKN
ncbi:MAG: NUDIX hydrolase [Clostridiales bacterium]|nr:NUDIX hydrolase [Clostridiales bacterium]